MEQEIGERHGRFPGHIGTTSSYESCRTLYATVDKLRCLKHFGYLPQSRVDPGYLLGPMWQ